MSKEVIKKLAKIFANQQRILEKLAQMPAPNQPKPIPEDDVYIDPESDMGSDLRESIQSLTAPEPEEEPDNFDEVLRHHLKNKGRWDHRQTVYQLEKLSRGEDPERLMEYYPGWKPQHFAKLVKKLK